MHRVVIEEDIAATMRDGTVLRADAFRPDGPGRFPTLLSRTPYDKRRAKFVETGRRLAERGYLVVFQDVRGRYASDGEFWPGFFSSRHFDAEDGYDTVEWAAGLPWSTVGWGRSATPTTAGPNGSWPTRGLPTWPP